MTNHLPTSDELSQVQLATARIDLSLKEQELRDKKNILRQLAVNPVVVAAVITLCITIATTYISYKQKEVDDNRAENQKQVARQVDEERFRLETNKSILLGII